MKLLTLAKRLAEKTNTPALEKVVLGELPVTELPMDCMVWTGAKYGGPRRGPRTHRSVRDGLRIEVVENERFYGVIRWQKKRIAVRRLLFLLINKPDYEFRMFNECGVDLCVNPLHHRVENVDPPEEPVEEPSEDPDADWLLSEVAEIIEIVLLEHEPKSWDDVVAYPLTQDVPHDMMREVLTQMNKRHLT